MRWQFFVLSSGWTLIYGGPCAAIVDPRLELRGRVYVDFDTGDELGLYDSVLVAVETKYVTYVYELPTQEVSEPPDVLYIVGSGGAKIEVPIEEPVAELWQKAAPLTHGRTTTRMVVKRVKNCDELFSLIHSS